jgi:hypothetical protein
MCLASLHYPPGQTSIITQLRNGGPDKKPDLFKEVSALANYFKFQKQYRHALPLSAEALALCVELYGEDKIESGVQLNKHALLLYCCGPPTATSEHREGGLEDALPLFKKALAITVKQLGAIHPLAWHALDSLAQMCVPRMGRRSPQLSNNARLTSRIAHPPTQPVTPQVLRCWTVS